METVNRLNYIGSKFQLLNWIQENITLKTGINDFKNIKIGDLFAGTGIVSYHFRNLGSQITSNDSELYSSIITESFVCSNFTLKLKNIIQELNLSIDLKNGFITRNFSPFENCERMYWTIKNAQRIDYFRNQIENYNLSKSEYIFLLASLLVSADRVANVSAVYGSYLKAFKNTANKDLILKPIHENNTPSHVDSKVTQKDVITGEFDKMDIVYLDPPYNERQYSKNYFPLNIIAMKPDEAVKQNLRGKTGIPENSFVSSFCQKKNVKNSFEELFKNIDSTWIFMSYSSESLITKDEMLTIMGKFGKADCVEREYKRFKAANYTHDETIIEYLFSLQKL